MFSDSLDASELHEMAVKIGMRRSWFQHKPERPEHDHYDVTKSRQALAVKAGAVEVSLERAAEIWAAKRGQLQETHNTKHVTDKELAAECRPVEVEVDGQSVTALACGPRGGELTDVDRQAIADFARFLRANARARQHRTTEPKEQGNG
jgi:hypothetical protein